MRANARQTPEDTRSSGLEADNLRLSEQVKALVKTEKELYEFQEQLDGQMRVYRHLYEVGKKLNATFSLEEILVILTGFALYDLNLERCAVLLLEDGAWRAQAADGWYEEVDALMVRAVEIPIDSKATRPLREGNEHLILTADGGDADLRDLGKLLGLDELVVFPLGGEAGLPGGLLIAGNSAAKAHYQARVKADSQFMIGLANLVSQASTAIANARNYRALEDERRLLEDKVHARTAELSALNENLTKLDRLKTQFFANISHELRTPLTLSIGPLELILKEGSGIEAGTLRNLNTVYSNQLRLLKLINDLLDFAKLEAGRMTARFRREDVVQTVRYYLGTLQAATDARRISLGFEAPPAAELFIDRDKFEKIVMNLLSNAFKFTPDGGAIVVRVEVDGPHLTIRVTDDGIGMPADALEKIFERFSQLDSSEKRAYQGTGIGLAMVKEFMQLHGGQVSVESAPGKGSTFTLRFRTGRDHLDPAAVETDCAAEVEGISAWRLAEFRVDAETDPGEAAADEAGEDRDAAGAPAERDLSDLARERVVTIQNEMLSTATVLVVDDTADMRRFVSMLLKPHYKVLTARDGQAGLELARKTFPDLIVSDVMMPRMSGYELCEAVKSDPGRLARTPVILLTAKADISMKLEGLAHGADDFLVKPFNAEELLSRARNLVKVRRQERELFLALRALEEKDQALNEDLSDARSFQQSILPRLPQAAGLEFEALYRPADMVGGDLYDVQEMAPGRFRVFLADATGHGVQASLRTMVIKTEYERFKAKGLDPAVVLMRLNQKIASSYVDLDLRFSACCFDVDVDPLGRGAVLHYANAGGLPLLHVHGGAASEVYQPGPFLGMVRDIELVSREVKLAPGDRLFAWTDGLVEAWNDKDELLPEEEVWAKLAEGATLAAAVRDGVSASDSFRGARAQGDDLTILGMELRGGPGGGAR